MSKLAWYWHRLRAMSPLEMALHARKKVRQFTDARHQPDWPSGEMKPTGAFPALPAPEKAPESLRGTLKHDTEEILAGRWKAFGHLELQVDDPPKWHKDYLVNVDLATDESAFNLNHRVLPDGADIKLIWELSRWHQLVRLAMAAYVLADDRARRKCIDWLEDWVKHNPPYRGWNWTSALEVGMRLIQFTWIDALLSDAGARTASAANRAGDDTQTRLSALREQILAPHAHFAWRHKSFGSSANNHLLGELVGLIVATVRWPELRRWATTVENLQRRWEHEVLAQFADDGGNKEQALNYQLFSWEFCWQARMTLAHARRKVSSSVEERIASAAQFFWEVQVRREPWDYGDSDNGFVMPFFSRNETALLEWRDWLSRSVTGLGAAPGYWLGEPPNVGQPLLRSDPISASHVNDWWIYQSSGVAVCELGHWWLRWDLSPLGYLSTAAHGHLDALHLSIWFKGIAVVIDPGTGAYYANAPLRSWLASRSAHNAPCPVVGLDFPERIGPFLWSEHHLQPTWQQADCKIQGIGVTGELRLPQGVIRRTVTRCADGEGWNVVDEFDTPHAVSREFTVHWQFAPGAFVKMLGERKFTVNRDKIAITVEVSGDWAGLMLVEDRNRSGSELKNPGLEALAGTISPSFRRVEWAPFLKLTARPEPGRPCVFRTTFLASPHS